MHFFIPLPIIEASPERHVLCVLCLVNIETKSHEGTRGIFRKKEADEEEGAEGRRDSKGTDKSKKSIFYAHLNRTWSNPLFFTIYINKNVRQIIINTSKIIKLSSPH